MSSTPKSYPPESITSASIIKVFADRQEPEVDDLATEEPLEIRVAFQRNHQHVCHQLAITMRTPGNDMELAAGFVLTEGILDDVSAIESVKPCNNPKVAQSSNVVTVQLHQGYEFDPERFRRNVYMSSSCGICGRTSLERVRNSCAELPVGEFQLSFEYFPQLLQTLSHQQTLFARTGGLHAAALFDIQGNCLGIFEDVGRHNALDKIIGALVLKNQIPASNTVLWVSGRASFELIQKAVVAGIPVMVCVGAPSSLAVDMAKEFKLTLLGFVREQCFNLYSGEQRLFR